MPRRESRLIRYRSPSLDPIPRLLLSFRRYISDDLDAPSVKHTFLDEYRPSGLCCFGALWPRNPTIRGTLDYLLAQAAVNVDGMT